MTRIISIVRFDGSPWDRDRDWIKDLAEFNHHTICSSVDPLDNCTSVLQVSVDDPYRRTHRGIFDHWVSETEYCEEGLSGVSFQCRMKKVDLSSPSGLKGETNAREQRPGIGNDNKRSQGI